MWNAALFCLTFLFFLKCERIYQNVDLYGLVIIWGASGSVLFQYIGVGREQFCQYIVSILEYSRGSFGGYWNDGGGKGRGLWGGVDLT